MVSGARFRSRTLLAAGGLAGHGAVMHLRLRILRVLTCVAFLFAARLLVPAAESPGQSQPQAQQAQQTITVPASAVPAPAVPRIDNARGVPGLSPDEIGNLTLPKPAIETPQNRVLPASVDNVSNANRANAQGASSDSERARPASAYSPTWLIDGVRQLEAESRQRLNPNARQAAGVSDEKTGSNSDDENENPRAGAAQNSAASASMTASAPASAPAPALADNALAAYLDKWITTPEGAAAARATLAREAGGDALVSANVSSANASANANAANPSFNGGVPAVTAAPATPVSAADNPYLDDMHQPQMETKGLHVVLPPPPIPPPETPATAAQPAPDAGNAPATTAPIDASHLKLKPITSQSTAPVVDEKKYFPQLQRF